MWTWGLWTDLTEKIDAYLYDRKAGGFERSSDGSISFVYDAEWLAQASANRAHPLSVSMPFEGGYPPSNAEAFMAGLLPDNHAHRRILADELDLGDDDSDFAFLKRLGKDCAGALVAVPEGEPPFFSGKPDFELLSDPDLESYLADLPRRPLLVDEEHGVLLSLAGVNDKAAVIVSKGRVGIPRNGFPSTHIIKMDIPGLKDSIKVEHFCLRLAEACGQKVPLSDIHRVGDTVFMLMRRYDRSMTVENDGRRRLNRIHQEDFCQALGYRPGKKYERHGGPGWKELFSLTPLMSDPVEARTTLLDRAVLQYLIGNPDAHAKNYSIVYGRDGSRRLSPFYDLNNAEAFRTNFKAAKPLLAMSVGGCFSRTEITESEWGAFAAECGLASRFVMARVAALSELAVEAAERLRSDVVGTEADSPLLDIVIEDVRSRAALWGRLPGALPVASVPGP